MLERIKGASMGLWLAGNRSMNRVRYLCRAYSAPMSGGGNQGLRNLAKPQLLAPGYHVVAPLALR